MQMKNLELDLLNIFLLKLEGEVNAKRSGG